MRHLTCQQTAELLRRAHRVVVGGHVRPDGDCLGAMAALGLGLHAAGIAATMVMTEPVPARYRFLAPHFTAAAPDSAADLIVVVDTSDRARIALPDALLSHGTPLLVIDHHAVGAHQADYVWCDPTQGAAACMIHDVLQAMQVAVRGPMADALYTGILTDTGCFTYPNADERVFALAHALVRAGVDTAQIARHVYESTSLAATRLLGAVLATLQCSAGARIAVMHVSQSMLRATGAVQSDIEDLINIARNIDSVVIAALITEQDDGRVRISLRSKDTRVNVGALAQTLGGGGHCCAAGATVDESLDLFLPRVPVLLEEFLAQCTARAHRFSKGN